ncbi:MAG: hypothetical protein IPN60_12015 [Saprospiraceae bacterium]|jgi:hypothetical protein|nr:hypothetical protein [Candidatus Opimibacter skivensis]MBL0009578.1 hypothetical protein [Candidatus Opimibacter skivensis]
MKSTFTELFTFKPILICLIMVGLYVVSAPTLQAQSTKVSDSFTTVPDVSYVSPSTAITLLDEQNASLKLQLQIYNSSSLEYKLANAKFQFFLTILQSIVDGKGTKESLVIGLGYLSSDASGNTLSKQKKQEFKDEAISLLTN